MIRDPLWRRRIPILFATAVAAAQACSTGRDDVGTNPTPTIVLNVNPTRATVVQGGSVVVTATLIGSRGFTGAGAALALTGAPDGMTFSISKFRTSGSIASATILTSVAPTVPPGTYTINLTGSGTGVREASASFDLTVPVPSIAISIAPASVFVAPGGSVDIAATLTGSGGFAGVGATFSLTGAPAGVTAAAYNLQTSDSVTTATITTSVAASVPPGTYALKLTGSGTGVSPVSASFALIVVGLGFTLSANPVTLATCEGCGDVTATITINRISGFTGSVLFSVSNSPVGQGGTFTTALNPSITTENSSILTMSTSAPPGNYVLAVTGTSPGFLTQVIPIAVTVW